ncbi:TPA: hypothetical protein SLP51_002280 [Klebsiella aerogenes]|nr:hypothetical protein [Klebsiella aerogenes]
MTDENMIPREGIYVSKTDPSLRITVTEVEVVSDEEDSQEDELFYLVHFVEGEDEEDPSVIEFELDTTEWLSFVKSEQLVYERDPYLDNIPENSNIAKIMELLNKAKKQ